MRRFASVFGMDLKNIFRNPVLVGYNTVFAALIILVMGYLTSGEYAQSRDAYQYYTVTMMVYGMLSGAMTASNSFMERDIRRPNLRIFFLRRAVSPSIFQKQSLLSCSTLGCTRWCFWCCARFCTYRWARVHCCFLP